LCIRYWNAVLACLACDIADRRALELLDWRYFYVDDDKRGHTTCGIVRLVAGALLRRVKKLNDFRDPVWQDRMVMSGKNPSVLGFHVEYLILLHIYRHGCLEAGPEFAKTGREMVFHEDLPPSLEPDFDGTILYRPASFNFPAVDGILVCRVKADEKTNAKAKAVVVGIQVTIARVHGDVEEIFFRSWKWWMVHMKCDENIEFRFLWIVENCEGRMEEKVPAKTREHKSGTKVVTPEYKCMVTTVEEVDRVIGGSLKRARELASQ